MNQTPSARTTVLNGWRVAGWGSLLALLALPALAMQITREVDWTASDFVFAAILLGMLGAMVELAIRFSRRGAARIGYLLTGLVIFFTFWSNAAVGIIGDDDAVNVYFFAMIVAAAIAGTLVRFRPIALRWIALSLAAGQYAVGVAALYMMPGHAVEWGVLSFFALLWLTVAGLFRRAAFPLTRAS